MTGRTSKKTAKPHDAVAYVSVRLSAGISRAINSSKFFVGLGDGIAANVRPINHNNAYHQLAYSRC